MASNIISIFALILAQLVTISVPFPDLPFGPFLSQFVSEDFPDTKIILVFGKSPENANTPAYSWNDKVEDIISSPHISSISGGVSNIYMEVNQTQYVSIRRPTKVVSAEVNHLVLLILPDGISGSEQESMLERQLILPLLNPPSIRNLDKYMIITEGRAISTLYRSQLIRQLKFKLFLTEEVEEAGKIILHQFCLHCPSKQRSFSLSTLNSFANSTRDLQYFPDFQKNYFGYVLRASSTDKMEGDLEFAVDPAGKTYAKRGIFASAMYHLAEGLNFTAEPYPSSAGASTGHTLPNGTWVGSVGDIYNGDAHFCMLCGMSYSRHFIVEITSPVTYEYIRFAIGPPDKLYTWQAIFWPFDGYLWMTLILTTVATTIVSALFLRWGKSNCSWNISTVAQYFGRIFIEQSQDLPASLPESLKIVIGYWLLFALVGTTIYRAKMVTFMTFPIYERVPETYEELVKSPYEIEFHYFPNIAYNSFKSSTNPVIATTFQKMLKQPNPIKCLQHTLISKSVCIMFTSVHEDMLSRNMSNRFGISPIRSSSNYAFMFTPGISSQKRAEFTRNFRKILQTSLAMGLNEWWSRSDAYLLLKQKNAWIKSLPPGGNRTGVFQYDNGDSDDHLHLRHLKGAFTVIIGGLLVALGFFILEQSSIFWEKFLMKRDKAKPRKKKWDKSVKLIMFHRGIENQKLRGNAVGLHKVINAAQT